MDILELVIPVVIFLMPMFAGAFKGYSANKLARIIADFASPAVSAVFMTFFLDYLLVNTGAIAPVAVASNIFYIGSLFAVTALLWYVFFRLVGFGSKITYREHAGIQSDLKNALSASSLIIGPLLKSFVESIEKNADDIMQRRNSEVLDYLKGMYDVDSDLIQKNSMVLQLIRDQNQKIASILDRQSKNRSILEQVAQYFARNPQLYERLLARIEAVSIVQQQAEERKGESYKDAIITDTVLTTQDGRANRIAGRRQQDEIAAYIRAVGIDATSQHGAGEADILLKKDGIYVGVASNKFYSLYDEPKRMQRRVSADDCLPEIILAKKLQVPMVLIVTNRQNNRSWAKLVSCGDLNSWKGISTPVILAKNDDLSGQMCQEEFLNVMASLGAKV